METLFGPDANENEYNDCPNSNDNNETPEERASRLRLWESFRRLDLYIQESTEKIKTYIDNNPHKPKSTFDFADETGLDRKELQKIFKHTYHVTISEYQFRKRIEAAAIMLEEGRLTHKQIACRCGYSNVNNFSRAFKKVYKLSPRHYISWQIQQLVNAKEIKKD